MGRGIRTEWPALEERLHRARIDLEGIAERYRAELSVAEFVNRSVCSECGARWQNISISLEPVSARRENGLLDKDLEEVIAERPDALDEAESASGHA